MNGPVRNAIAYVGLLSSLLLINLKTGLSQQNPGLTLSANQVNFFSLPSGGTATQTLTVSTSSSSAVIINTANVPSWLQIAPNGSVNVSAGTPTTLTVTATPPAGVAPGSYDASFTVGIQGGTATPQTVVVTTFVTGTSVLSASPSSLTFTAQPGASEASPLTQSVKISSSGPALDFTASASTSSGQNWLIPFTLNGITGSASGGGSNLTIGVNPAGLAAGTYLGQVLVQSATTQDSVTIAVELTVGTSTSLNVTPASIQPFFYQANTPVTATMSQQLTVTTSASAPNFNVSVSPQVPWLGAAIAPPTTTSSGSKTSTVTLMVLPVQTAGVYNTALTITNGVSQVTIPISYTVGTGQVPQTSPNQLTFTASATQVPAPQTVQVSVPNATGSAAGVAVTSDSPWLTGALSNLTTPATLTVSVNPAGLAAGTYTGTLSVRSTNGDQYAVPISVKLTVTGAPPLLTSGPPVLLFTNQIGQAAPPAQLLQLNSNGQALSFTTSTSTTSAPNCPANFLQASAPSANPSTPSAVSVSITPSAAMTAGICSGTVTLNYSNAGTIAVLGSIQVPVIVETSASPLVSLSVPAGFGFETANVCSAVSTSNSGSSTSTGNIVTQCSVVMRQITLTSTDGLSPLSFTASATNTGTIPWLFVAPNSGQTPAVLSVLIDPTGLAAGTYNGSITVSSSQSTPSGLPMPITIPVSLTIRSNITVTASQSTLNFSQNACGTVPAPQTFTLSSSAPGATFSASVPNNATCGWVNVSPMSGAATGTITVSVAANTLAANTYSCPITLTLTGASTQSIQVTANLNVGLVGVGTTVSASPSTLNFTQTAGGSAPASKTLTLTSSATGPTFTAVLPTTPNCGWVTVSPMSGPATGTVTVGVAANSLTQNTYTCIVTLMLTGAATASIPVTAILTVNPAQGPTQPVTVSPASLTFTYSNAVSQPAPQQLVISNASATGSTTGFSITASSSGWLSVTPAQGTAPANITVSVNPLSVGSGSAPFTGTITITPTGSSTPITVPVTLNHQ